MRHDIATIEQLTAVVNSENVDVLKSDIGQWLEMIASIKGGLNVGIGVITPIMDTFSWVDDGEKGLSGVEVTIKKEENNG